MQYNIQFSSVQSLSRVWLCDPMDRSTPGLPIHLIPEITQTHVHWVCDAIQPSNPPLLPPSIFPSIRVFSNESALHVRWPKNWSFSFNISPSNEHPGLISFEWTGWTSLQSKGLTESSPTHSSKASILQHSAFFTVQLSHPYMTTGETIPLTRPTFVGKVMSLLLNMRSRWVITFLPRSKRLLISWLQSPSAVILQPQKKKSDTFSTVSPSMCHEVKGIGCQDLCFLNVEL